MLEVPIASAIAGKRIVAMIVTKHPDRQTCLLMEDDRLGLAIILRADQTTRLGHRMYLLMVKMAFVNGESVDNLTIDALHNSTR